jgi:single-stranded-DNA-specific exonuclease
VLLADAIARTSACASWPTTTATAPPPAPSACAACACWARKHVSYLVPDRVVDGYGLTPPIAERVADSGADMLITVDNGIASVDGVAAAKARSACRCW